MKLPQPERSGGTNALLAALVVASLVITTVYYREGDDGLLHRVRRGTEALTAPVSAAGEWATGPLRATGKWFSGLSVSKEEYNTLKTQNVELRSRVAELEEARLENERLRDLVGFIEARKLEGLGARVIGRPASAWEGVITIDRGSADGVDVGMPVLGAQGLLGQTVDVTAHSAKVRLITDQRSGVSALIQSTRAEGVVRGSIDGALSMEYVSRESTVVVGDVVLTSGMGGVYPKGLIIGEVSDVQLAANDLYQHVAVRPSARISGIEEVIVLVGAPPTADVGGGE